MSGTSGEGGKSVVCSRQVSVPVPERECSSSVAVERLPQKESCADESSTVDNNAVPSEVRSKGDPTSAVQRTEDVTSPGESASHDPAPGIAPTLETPPDEAEDQGVEVENTSQSQLSVESIEGPPSRRTRSKASAHESTLHFLVTSISKSDGVEKNARPRDSVCLSEAQKESESAPAE